MIDCAAAFVDDERRMAPQVAVAVILCMPGGGGGCLISRKRTQPIPPCAERRESGCRVVLDLHFVSARERACGVVPAAAILPGVDDELAIQIQPRAIVMLDMKCVGAALEVHLLGKPRAEVAGWAAGGGRIRIPL